jgi:hypothetical protein
MGINAWHLRMLCESPWEGGAGYTPQQVGQMTLDQIWFRLCDKEILKRDSGLQRGMTGLDALSTLKPDEDGMFKGRATDGTPMKAKIGGKSLARRLMEQQEKEEEEKERKEARRRRREKKRQRKERQRGA